MPRGWPWPVPQRRRSGARFTSRELRGTVPAATSPAAAKAIADPSGWAARGRWRHEKAGGEPLPARQVQRLVHPWCGALRRGRRRCRIPAAFPPPPPDAPAARSAMLRLGPRRAGPRLAGPGHCVAGARAAHQQGRRRTMRGAPRLAPRTSCADTRALAAAAQGVAVRDPQASTVKAYNSAVGCVLLPRPRTPPRPSVGSALSPTRAPTQRVDGSRRRL